MSERRRTTAPEIVAAVQRQTVLGYSPTQIQRQLEADGVSGVPSLRTIQYIAREVRPTDDSDIWSPATADPDEAELVMPVLVALVRVGQLTSLTQAMARWIAVVRRVGPQLETLDVLLFAGRYLAAQRAGAGYADVDLALARHLARERPPG